MATYQSAAEYFDDTETYTGAKGESTNPAVIETLEQFLSSVDDVSSNGIMFYYLVVNDLDFLTLPQYKCGLRDKILSVPGNKYITYDFNGNKLINLMFVESGSIWEYNHSDCDVCVNNCEIYNSINFNNYIRPYGRARFSKCKLSHFYTGIPNIIDSVEFPFFSVDKCSINIAFQSNKNKTFGAKNIVLNNSHFNITGGYVAKELTRSIFRFNELSYESVSVDMENVLFTGTISSIENPNSIASFGLVEGSKEGYLRHCVVAIEVPNDTIEPLISTNTISGGCLISDISLIDTDKSNFGVPYDVPGTYLEERYYGWNKVTGEEMEDISYLQSLGFPIS